MKKTDQQSRSGWGGKRTGAGAPYGNTNALKHGGYGRKLLPSGFLLKNVKAYRYLDREVLLTRSLC